MKCKKELSHKPGLPSGKISHGLCSTCEDEFNKEIDRIAVTKEDVDGEAKQTINILDFVEFYKRADDDQRTTLENLMDDQKYAEAKKYMDSINYGNFPQNAYQGWAASRKGAS